MPLEFIYGIFLNVRLPKRTDKQSRRYKRKLKAHQWQGKRHTIAHTNQHMQDAIIAAIQLGMTQTTANTLARQCVEQYGELSASALLEKMFRHYKAK